MKYQALDGLDVGAGGDHVHGNGDAGIEAVAEFAEDAFGVFGGIRSLLTEGVALVEFIPNRSG